MTKRERLEYVRAQLAAYEKLERSAFDDVGWITFRLGCSRAVAARLVEEVRASEGTA
jgi:hypothetical protein